VTAAPLQQIDAINFLPGATQHVSTISLEKGLRASTEVPFYPLGPPSVPSIGVLSGSDSWPDRSIYTRRGGLQLALFVGKLHGLARLASHAPDPQVFTGALSEANKRGEV
jgi:hypothetical protein